MTQVVVNVVVADAALLGLLFVGACEYVLYVRRVGLGYGNLLDTVVSESDVHAIAVVAEDTYLVLVDDLSPVAADEVVAELVLDGLGGAAQHVIA